MKKYLFLVLVMPLLFSFTMHKYYLSVMDLEYNEEAKAIQMVTRIFYDDLEDVLNERYDAGITVDTTEDQKKLDSYLKKYLNAKITVVINGVEVPIHYIGKEYEDDYVVCYLEIPNIEKVDTFEMTNGILMDLFPEQKNMVHTSILEHKKSFLFTTGNANAVLNFAE